MKRSRPRTATAAAAILVTTAASLEEAATALKLDPAHFTAYSPAELTGAEPAG